jgi:glycosyltransferase involved in cell wall biosynthesis
LPKNISVNYFGPITHELVHQTLSDYHLFFLPTLGENFGHAIFEALSVGVPVLISDQTPWTDIVNKSNYAAIPLNNQKKYVDFIKHLSMMDNDEFINLKSHAAKVFKKYISSDNYTIPYNELF